MIFRWLGVLLGSLSLVSLCQAGFELPPFAPLPQSFLDADDAIKRIIFALLEPALTRAAALLNEWTGWNLQFYPYWKHVVVLLWLYFGGGARMAWRQGDRNGAVFRVVLGGVIAVPAGAAFGLVPMEADAAASLANVLARGGMHVGGWVSVNLLAVIFPVAAVVLFALGVAAWVATVFDREQRSWWAAFSGYASTFPLMYGYVGFASIVAAMLLANVPVLRPLIEALRNPGLLLLLLLIVCMAFFLRWSERLMKRDNNLGLLMLQSIFGAVGFVFADATWRLATG